MKQHITLKQWDELTHDQKDKLDDYGCENDWRMTIGQMIWFMNEHWNTDWSILFGRDVVFVGEQSNDYVNYHKSGNGVCNALWEAVKEVLNE